MMKILITGAGGFIGKNLVESLKGDRGYEILTFNSSDDPGLLIDYTETCEFLFHLAAVHRPVDESEFFRVNELLFSDILALLRGNGNSCPVLLSSSIQAVDDNPYGRSKRAAEDLLKDHAARQGSRAIIYRLTNTFGRYARPHGHSVVATFCYNIARNIPIKISDPARAMNFYYIDDVIASFREKLEGDYSVDSDGFCRLSSSMEYRASLRELADYLYSFHDALEEQKEPQPENEFSRKLYLTYLSYLPPDKKRVP